MTTVIVKQGKDGRGHVRPFGLSPEKSKTFAGQSFDFYGVNYKIGKDGRMHIPKSFFEDKSINGKKVRLWNKDKNGKKVIEMQFSSLKGGKGSGRRYKGDYFKPDKRTANKPNQTRIKRPKKLKKQMVVSYSEFNWSP